MLVDYDTQTVPLFVTAVLLVVGSTGKFEPESRHGLEAAYTGSGSP